MSVTRTVFLFPGQGSQYLQMGVELFRNDAVFREWMLRFDKAAAPRLGGSLVDVLYGDGRSGAPFARTLYSHPAIFAVEYSLAQALMARGIQPDALMGVSLGELSAATVAGVFEPEEALDAVINQALIVERHCPPGAMLAVLGDPAILERESLLGPDVELAGYNDAFHFVLAGEKDALQALAARFEERRLATVEVPVSYAFHSSRMDPVAPRCLENLRARTYRRARLPLVSGMDGEERWEISAEYLWSAVREPMTFCAAVRRLVARGEHAFIDVGPSSSLANLMRGGVARDGRIPVFSLMTPAGGELEKVKKLEGALGPKRAATPSHREKKNMMTYVFPGQGTQRKGMGARLFDAFPQLTDRASEILGYSLRELCLKDPEGRLSQTQYTQPALFVVNALSYLEKKDEAGEPDFLAGHSLGEYNALCAAESFDFETGLRLVKRRGELMAEAKGGGMAAVVGLSREQVEAVLASRPEFGALDLANINSPSQVVIAGPTEAIQNARAAFEGAGARAYVPLKVSAAFHSRYMAPASEAFGRFLAGFEFKPPRIPVVSNVEARPHAPDRVRQLLQVQIARPVNWAGTIQYLLQQPGMEIAEVGPGMVLTNLMRDFPAPSTVPAAAPVTAAPTSALHPGAEIPRPVAEPASARSAVASTPASWSGAEAPRPMAEPASARSAVASTPVSWSGAEALRPVAEPASARSAVASAPASRPLAESLRSVAEPARALVNGHDPHRAAPAWEGVSPASLGSAEFRADYGIKYAYVAGAMYRGIASKEMVVALGRAGMLGFFGAGGLPLRDTEQALHYIQRELSRGEPYGMNLLSSPQNPQLEEDTVDLYLKYGVRNVEAASYMVITPALVRFRLQGLFRDASGGVTSRHRIMAKVSRPEVAEAFLRPASERIVKRLLEQGRITREQAELSTRIALADDLCVEADSGGHTDRGVAYTLTPTIIRLRDKLSAELGYTKRIRVGAAGGIGTPEAAAAAFMLGADFILTGSINQCTVESGTSDAVKELLQGLNVQDFDHAPAGDLFELGARVQVVKKGVFFPARANKLYELYRFHDSIEDIDAKTREHLQNVYFRKSFDEVYEDVKSFYPRAEIEKAEQLPKYKMALIFKWYFGYSSRLALSGSPDGKVDYQVHSGPAMGAFNQWVKGTRFESWKHRRVAEIGEHLVRETARLVGDRLQAFAATRGESLARI
uniref:[acyl-carrier-protein] S-malonyltransferase n=1 Tax=Pyxidicoccus sp. MCy9557 TaxID=2012863 RepID=A0A1Z2TJM8_9BACT|nr:malonyl-CoA acyl carrier protein transacylase [Pyxidicoccus sp. MCy9557]